MDAMKKIVSGVDHNVEIMSGETAEVGAISIDEIAMREEKSCWCLCEYDAS